LTPNKNQKNNRQAKPKNSRASAPGRILRFPIAEHQAGRQIGYLPFGLSYEARLPYSEDFTITGNGTAGTSATTYAYRANSCYDPRWEAGGLQPLQFDSVAPHYERWRVNRATVRVRFYNPTDDGVLVGVRVRANTNSVATAGQSISYLTELENVLMKPLSNSGSQVCEWEFDVDIRKMLGVSPAAFGNFEYSETASGAVSVPVFVEPFVVDTVSGSTASARCTVKIVYHVRFTNKISQAQS
jgi:hypothetical protein